MDMGQVRELIYAVCLCAILNAGVRLLSPDKLRKEVRIISTLMLILCAAARISGGFTVGADELFPQGETRQESFGSAVLTETEPVLRARLDSKLAELGITDAETGIVCTLDEYNYVKAERVYIRLTNGHESEKELALGAARELFPEAETEVTAGDEEAR